MRLCFLISDTRVPDYRSIISFILVLTYLYLNVIFMHSCANVNMAAQQHITPTVMIRGSLSHPKDAFLAVEREVLSKTLIQWALFISQSHSSFPM